MLQIDLPGGSVPGFGGLEGAFLRQPFLLERLTTPEEKTHALLPLAVTDHRFPLEKPYRVGVPDLVFRLWQSLVDLPSEKIADFTICWLEGLVVLCGVGVHNGCPSGGTRCSKLNAAL